MQEDPGGSRVSGLCDLKSDSRIRYGTPRIMRVTRDETPEKMKDRQIDVWNLYRQKERSGRMPDRSFRLWGTIFRLIGAAVRFPIHAGRSVRIHTKVAPGGSGGPTLFVRAQRVERTADDLVGN